MAGEQRQQHRHELKQKVVLEVTKSATIVATATITEQSQ